MIRVCADFEGLSHAAAELFAAEMQQAVQARGRFVVALAGGSTPRRTYELLAQEPFRDLVPWQNTHIFWGDERCVPADDQRNNAQVARQTLLDHVSVPSEQVHPMVCDRSPREAAVEYEALLRTFSPPVVPDSIWSCWDLGRTATQPHSFLELPSWKSNSTGWPKSMWPKKGCTGLP